MKLKDYKNFKRVGGRRKGAITWNADLPYFNRQRRVSGLWRPICCSKRLRRAVVLKPLNEIILSDDFYTLEW